MHVLFCSCVYLCICDACICMCVCSLIYMLHGPANRLSAQLIVDKWLMDDFDASTRVEVCRLLEDEQFDEITARLGGANKLVFGTAGLRARMGPGFDRMNCLTVLQTTQGLAAYLKEVSPVTSASVVVGFDGRHNSEKFAHVVAAVFVCSGFRVHLIERPSPTPFCPFSVPIVGALCGVQVTASHNPKSDNGYKLFWNNGAQIIPPIDSQIANMIEKNRTVNLNVVALLCPETLLLKPEVLNDTMKVELSYGLVSKMYMDRISAELAVCGASMGTEKFCYTAMHGVGFQPFKQLFEKFGHLDNCELIPVVVQMEIDPEFSTLKFPNPEEKGALKLAIATAEETGCKYVLANDPDVDRFTAAEKQIDGSWYQFTGDELGLLFADYQIRKHRGDKKRGLIVSSVVSSRMVSALCEVRSDANVLYRDCLTGFKWIANESCSYREKESNCVHLLGYEEAIGYQLSAQVADKDGLSAGCVFVQMVLESKKGFLKNRIDQIQAEEIGYFVTNNGYYLVDDPSVTCAIFAEFRNSGMKTIGDFKIKSVRDVTRGTDNGGLSHLPATPEAEMIQMIFENEAVVTIRASGTEPKVKYYTELASKISALDAKTELDKVVAAIKKDFYQPHKYPMKEQPVM